MNPILRRAMAVGGGFIAVIGFLLVIFFSNLLSGCIDTCSPPSINWGQLSLILMAISIFFLGLFVIASAVRPRNWDEEEWQKPVFSVRWSPISVRITRRA